MQSEYGEAIDRDMACTEPEWLRWLPGAVGERAWQAGEGSALVQIGGGTLRLAWQAGEPRAIALLRLPRLMVRFRFEDVSPEDRRAFMRRFDLYMQRGGG
jgi:hypothetical protein